MKRATMSEAALQRHVVKLLQAFGHPDVCFWHCPNGELRHRSVGAKLKLAGVRAGVADLNFVIDGRFHALELKTETGALSEAQYLFGEDIERAGGFYHVARGLDQALGVLRAIGAFRANTPAFLVSSVADGDGVRERPRKGRRLSGAASTP